MNIDSDHQLDKSQLSRLLSVIQSVPTHVAIISLAPPPHHSTQTYKILFRTLLVIKPTKCSNFSNLFLEWNSARFGQFLCPSSGVFRCTHSNGISHTGLLTACEQEQMLLLTSCHQTCMTYTIAAPAHKLSANLYDIYHCCVHSEKLPMMDRGTVRNVQSFIPKINLRNYGI